jgi:hypothetical protein
MRPFMFCMALLLALGAAPASAELRPTLTRSLESVLTGGGSGNTTAEVDTIILIGPWASGAQVNGQFQDFNNWTPQWNDWTHHDMTEPEGSRWTVSPYHADNLAGHGVGNLAAWCGEFAWPACNADDEAGGYGNNYDERLIWSGSVADPAAACVVSFEAWLNHDLEPGYDYLYLRYATDQGEPVTVRALDGAGSNVLLQESFEIQPADYLEGPIRRDVVQIELHVISDGGWSDADCLYPSVGACQIDDITVHLGNGDLTIFENFQSGTFGSWQVAEPVGVGDFAHISPFLEDMDPCQSNYTPVACFIDDGYVIPETGGQFCINWCYGPGGYIVNTQGGLAGPDKHLHNQIRSPVIAWPASGAEGALLTFDVYNHEELDADAPGIFYTWHVRGTTSPDPQDLQDVPWLDRNFVYYGPPAYRRPSYDISDLLPPGTTYVQVAFAAIEAGWYWGWDGDDGYPAPYFDSVRLVAFPFDGPAISARTIDLAQDGFPAGGVLDTEDPAANSVRFDMAMNIAPPADLRIDPGDSIIVRVTPRRAGAWLVGMPRLHYKLETNPLFDSYRTSGLPDEGYVDGYQGPAFIFGDRFAFDLPDTGFFFPGDVLHYFITATTTTGSGGELTSTLPADTTGFADFSGPMAYDPGFTVRALPSVRWSYQDALEQDATILLWLDGGDLETWYEALQAAPYFVGGGYDIFQTRGPSSGVGNGLGSRATVEVLDGYRTLLYSSGMLSSLTICNGDFQLDGSDDVGLLDAWMNRGDKSMFLTGDNLATDLYQSGAATGQFLSHWMQVQYLQKDLRLHIDNQTAPEVVADPGGFFFSLDRWVAYGGCLDINTFDMVEPVGPAAVRLAEFADPSGQTGTYSYAAGVLHDLPETRTVIPSHNSAVISLPYDLEFIYTSQSSPPPYPLTTARGLVLYDVLYFFGEIMTYDAVQEAPTARLEARNFPNPFNPATSIEYSLPREGLLRIKIFDVRGGLVRELVHENRPAGPGTAVWDGADGQGAQAASGIYFYEVRAAGQVKVGKMALLK